MTIKEYVKSVIASFDEDPADTRYQEGYLAAYEDMLKEIEWRERARQ